MMLSLSSALNKRTRYLADFPSQDATQGHLIGEDMHESRLLNDRYKNA